MATLKDVSIHSDGYVYVKGGFTGLVQWKSDPKRWSNAHGRELTEYAGMGPEEVLKKKGLIQR